MGKTRKISNNHLIQPRPYANPGLWVGFLLPLCILVSLIKHSVEASKLYQLTALLTLGILYTTTVFIIRYSSTQCTVIPKRSLFLPFIVITALYHLHFDKGLAFSCFASLLSTLGFYKLYLFVLSGFPQCFTLGEALACAQGFTIFIFSSIVNIMESFKKPPKTTSQMSTITLQVGLLTVTSFVYMLYKHPSLRSPKLFYPSLFLALTFLMVIPLQILILKNPLVWIFELFTRDTMQIKIFLYWSLCISAAVYTLIKQISGAQKASSVVRKTFHILAVLIYVPGLLAECSILYLASGVVLGLFIGIETTRLIRLPQVVTFLEDGFSVFRDEKDIGSVALTPMYLLAGVSFPIWIHPSPCDMTNSAGFNLLPLLSGILSIGVGDSAASYLGAWIGKHKWKGSFKTIEGTMGCVLSQVLFIYLLMHLGYVDMHLNTLIKVGLAITVTSVVEAKTTQVDNLVLPMVMYLMLV
ncbi:dolichol kinase [Onthophagus taurus]|uniref:dolichol kinase n=1 Tax=Onthophagus taurus TaxID=166361 RepID=UPI000C201B82|nr:dolichol kinase-like [Onthophagus taurus]